MKNKKTHTKPGNKNDYKLLYSIEPHPEGLTKADVAERGENAGACDAALLASIIYPPDGSWSVVFIGVDGRTSQALDDSEMFKVWTMLGNRLAQSDTLSDLQRDICAAYFESVRDMVLEQRAADPNDMYPNSIN